MKTEQKLVLIYLLLGILSGIISNQFTLVPAVIIPLAIYFISLIFFTRIIKMHMKKSKLFYESLFTFVLVWLVVWIFIFNL